MSQEAHQKLHVGIVGGGIGGLATAIAVRRAGARVTVLEAATQLGEIGAGIQITANVSRFLIRTGVDKIIGDDLVATDEVRNWTATDDGTPDPMGTGKLIGKLYTKDIVKNTGFPWWVVRRDHLHAGLAEGARRHGAELIIDARVASLHASPDGVRVTTEKGREYHFDLVIGADGINSTVRKTLFPNLKPKAASSIAAYRSVVPYETVFNRIPEARSILGNTMDAWAGPGGYILLYPLSAGRELNVVTAHTQDHPVTTLEDVSLSEFKNQYKDFPPFIRKILDLVPSTKRWPLLVVPPTKTWSNPHKNIVLMGDAIHGMQNHMAQGAATSIEDGIFLGRTLSSVLRGTLPLHTAITIYEDHRRPRAWHKQQSALCQGEMWTCSGRAKPARDHAESATLAAWMRNPAHPEPSLPPTFRSSMLFMSPTTVPGILNYDAEADADFAVGRYLMGSPGGNHDGDGDGSSHDHGVEKGQPTTQADDTTPVNDEGDNEWDPTRLVSARLLRSWWSAVWDNGVEAWERNRPDAAIGSGGGGGGGSTSQTPPKRDTKL